MAVTGCGAAVDSNQKSASEGISNTVEEVAAEASNETKDQQSVKNNNEKTDGTSENTVTDDTDLDLAADSYEYQTEEISFGIGILEI